MTTPRNTSKRGAPDKATQLVECWQLRVEGKSIREIAQALGMSNATVCRRVQEAFEARVSPAREEMRALENDRLDRAVSIALDIAETAEDPEVRLKALDRLTKASERRSHMHGLDEPAKSVVANVGDDPGGEWGALMAEARALVALERKQEGGE